MTMKTAAALPPVHEDFRDARATAHELGLSERRLRDGVNHHGFPHHRMGRKLRFSSRDRAEIAAIYHRPLDPARAPRRVA